MARRQSPSIERRYLGAVAVEFDPTRRYVRGTWGDWHNSGEWADPRLDTRPAKRQSWRGWPLCWSFRYGNYEDNRRAIRQGLIDPSDPLQRGHVDWSPLRRAVVPRELLGQALPHEFEEVIPWIDRERRIASVYPIMWRRSDAPLGRSIRFFEDRRHAPEWTVTVVRERGVDSAAVVEAISTRWAWITSEPTGRAWHDTKQPPWLGIPLPPSAAVNVPGQL
jgi:hypothetical protein